MLELCGQFHCLPSQLYAEDSEVLRMIKIVELGTPREVSYGE